MKILALEFSSARRTVSIGDQDSVHCRRLDGDGRPPGAFEIIDEVLREAALEREQIGCIAVGLGPGSYTGIRSAIAIAQGWELALGVPLRGISSADGIAWEAQAARLFGLVNAVIDAQRGEFYLGRYQIDARAFAERVFFKQKTAYEVTR